MSTDYNAEILKADFITDGRDTLPRHDTKKWNYRDPSNILGACFHQSLEEYGSASGNARYHAGPNHIRRGGRPASNA